MQYTGSVATGTTNSLDGYINTQISKGKGMKDLKVLDTTVAANYSQLRDNISNPDTLNSLIQALQKNDFSTASMDAMGVKNYIAQHDQTNARFLYYYTSIISALNQAYELEKLSLYLDDEKLYNGYYTTRISSTDKDMYGNLPFDQKVAALNKLYSTAFKNVEAAFNKDKLVDIYRDLPNYKAASGSMKTFGDAYGVTSYDGKNVCGEQAQFAGMKSKVPYCVTASDIYELGKIRTYSGQYYYVYEGNQDIIIPGKTKVLGGDGDGAVRYDWYDKKMKNMVIRLNSFADAKVAENLYGTPMFKLTNDMWGKNFNTPVDTNNAYVGDGGGFYQSAVNVTYNNIIWVRSNAEGANPKNNGGPYSREYLFSLSALNIGGDFYGYTVNSLRSKLFVYRLSCATTDCIKVPSKNGKKGYLQFSDGYKIWITGDLSTNIGEGLVGSYTRSPSN